LPARLDFSGVEVRGTVDDISTNGLRFYGHLPRVTALGGTFKGQITLPEGPLAVSGQIRSLDPLSGSAEIIKAFGAEFTTSSEDRKRLERFLFGSDLQWQINGYCEQAATPLSRFMPALVEGPHQNPFAAIRWNAAELRIPGRPSAQVLASLRDPEQGEAWVLSFSPLPEGSDVVLRSFRRMAYPREIVRLHRMHEYDHTGSGVFAYRTIISSGDVRRALDPRPASAGQKEVA
jgi:cellulose synthase (UDP-forming)